MSTENAAMSAEDAASADRAISILTQAAKDNARTVFTLGIAIIILGALAALVPLVTGTTAVFVVAVLLVAAGIARTIFAFKAESWGRGILIFFIGVGTILCGLFLLARPLAGLAALTLIVAVYFFADGVFECIAAFKMKPIKGWGWMLFSGLASVVLGFMIAYEWPASGTWAIGLLIGIRLVFSGWSMVVIGGAGDQIADEVAAAAAAD